MNSHHYSHWDHHADPSVAYDITIIRCEHRCKILIEIVGLGATVSDKDAD